MYISMTNRLLTIGSSYSRLNSLQCLSTSKLIEAKNNSEQISKLTRKFLANPGTSKKKNKTNVSGNQWPDLGISLNTDSKPKPVEGLKLKRLTKLNNVFLEKISEILSLHDVASELASCGTEILECNVLSNYSSINIHWMCTMPQKEVQVQELLDKIAPSIRHNLIQQRVIGKVPPIRFVRDKYNFKSSDVEKALSMADFGPDFEPYDPQHYIKADIIQRQMSDDTWRALEKASEEGESSKMSEDVKLPNFPVMRHDVFGVKRNKIMQVVEEGVKGMKADHRQKDFFGDFVRPSPDDTGTSVEIPFMNNNDEKQVGSNARVNDIKRWVEKYRNEERKRLRREQRMDKQMLLVNNDNINNVDNYADDKNNLIFEDNGGEDDFLEEYDRFCKEQDSIEK